MVAKKTPAKDKKLGVKKSALKDLKVNKSKDVVGGGMSQTRSASDPGCNPLKGC